MCFNFLIIVRTSLLIHLHLLIRLKMFYVTVYHGIKDETFFTERFNKESLKQDIENRD